MKRARRSKLLSSLRDRRGSGTQRSGAFFYGYGYSPDDDVGLGVRSSRRDPIKPLPFRGGAFIPYDRYRSNAADQYPIRLSTSLRLRSLSTKQPKSRLVRMTTHGVSRPSPDMPPSCSSMTTPTPSGWR